jgi:hypothetical protein
LVEDLDRKGIRTKRRLGGNGRSIGGIRFGVGPLAHLLRNRFYIGDVVYRGGVHTEEHEPIVDRDLFAAVQGEAHRRRGRSTAARERVCSDSCRPHFR